MLEALACGTPVAAFPLAGPAELLGHSGAGVLHPDLRTAALRALDVPRERALARARDFDWADTTRQFLDTALHLIHPIPLVAGKHYDVLPLPDALRAWGFSASSF